METKLNLDDYFNRVNLTHRPRVDETGLFDLHHAQFFTIPFENLDIHLGKKISVKTNSIFEKLVYHKRGGYCFELNNLMLYVLKTLGYIARPLLARVHLSGEPGGRTHLLILVELNNKKWIVDVGFGGSGLREPILLDEKEFSQVYGLSVKLSEQAPWGWLLETKDKDEWKETYSFDLGHVIHSDILLGNHFTSTSELTHFTKSITVSMPTKLGRKSIKDLTFTRNEGGVITNKELIPNNTFIETLKEEFDIELSADFKDLNPLYK